MNVGHQATVRHAAPTFIVYFQNENYTSVLQSEIIVALKCVLTISKNIENAIKVFCCLKDFFSGEGRERTLYLHIVLVIMN